MANRIDKKVQIIRQLSDRMSRACLWSKGTNGPRRIDQKFDEASLREHAAGIRQYGLAPIAPGSSTTQVACLDFDSHGGETPMETMQAVAQKVVDVLDLTVGFKPTLFTSSGGKGIHLYLVWDEPQDAYSVRQVLFKALELCELKNGTGGVHKGEVEVFPKQDSVPADGWGNMFVLPFAGKSKPITTSTFEPSPSVPVLEKPVTTKIEHATFDFPGYERLQSALAAIPNEDGKDLDYDQWFRIICGIHHATDGSDDGLALAHEWSSRSSKYDRDFLDSRVWPYVRSDRDGSMVTSQTIFNRAARNGWVDPSVVDGFDVLPDEPASDSPARSGRFPLIRDLVVASLPRTDWHVKEALPIAELIILYGPSASGKSFLALDLAYAVATGTPWRGKHVKQGRVLYIAAEGAGGFRNRVRAVRAHRNITGDVDIMFLLAAPNVMNKDDIKDLCASITEAGKFDIVFIDTFAQVTPGANENAGEDMGLALKNCRTIGKAAGGSVVLVHHSGKDESRGARGWSGLFAAADAVLKVTRENDDRCLTVEKQKDGEDGKEYPFELHAMKVDTDDQGAPITSCFIVHSESNKAQPSARTERKPNEGTAAAIVLRAAKDMFNLDPDTPVPVKKIIDQAIQEFEFDPGSKSDRRRDNAMRALRTLREKGEVKLMEMSENDPETGKEVKTSLVTWVKP